MRCALLPSRQSQVTQIVGRLMRCPFRESLFKIRFRQILRTETEGNRSGKHDASEAEAKAHDDNIPCDTELLQRHGDRHQLNAPSREGRHRSRRRETGIDGGNEHSLTDKVRKQISDH